MVNVANKLNIGMYALPYMSCLMPLPDSGKDLGGGGKGAATLKHGCEL